MVGPTAAGKTEISLEVAAHLDGEIISADSMQVYRDMNIGTAKIKNHEMISAHEKKIPHHLIDIRDPDQDFSVADFQILVRKLIRSINLKEKTPLLVGGTGLYISSIIDPYHFTDQKTDPELRKKLFEEAEKWGNQYVHQKLAKIDPDTAEKLHQNDLRRVVRALETFYQTNKTISSIQKAENQQPTYDLVMIGIFLERQLLYQKINQRVDQMIRAGLIEEVKQLMDKGYSPHLKSMQGLGYRQIAAYLTGILTREEAIHLLKRDTRHFAKRQFTWFKRDQRIKWFNADDFSKKSLCAEKIIEYIGRTTGNSVE